MIQTVERRVLVTGGTGHLGRLVAPELKRAGLKVRVLSRRAAPVTEADTEWAQGDYVSGAGLAQALEGVDTVLHTAHDPQHPKADLEGLERLLSACKTAGVRHFVQVGIVGAERVPGYPYYAGKVQAERLVESSGLPSSVFRATQFHGFVASLLLGLERLPLVPVPAGSLQPVDVREVAAALAEHVRRGETGIEAFAGPHVQPIADLAGLHLASRGLKRVLPLSLPVPALRAIGTGALTDPGAARGRLSFEDWLRERTRG